MTASDNEESPIQIWLLHTGENASRITTDLNVYDGLNLTADSNALVTTQNGQLMNIWMQADGEPECARQIKSGVTTSDGLSGISWTPEGRIVYSSSARAGETIGSSVRFRLPPSILTIG